MGSEANLTLYIFSVKYQDKERIVWLHKGEFPPNEVPRQWDFVIRVPWREGRYILSEATRHTWQESPNGLTKQAFKDEMRRIEAEETGELAIA